MGLTEPERDTDEHIVFSEPKRGVFKSIVIRDGKIVGATLLGNSKKLAFLQQAFDRGLPLPEERVELLFDLGGPAAEVGVAELADDAQICNCNGVCKSVIVDTVKGGCKTVSGVMEAPRAEKGCGSCKGLVAQLVEYAADGAIEEDPSAHYYVLGIPMDKPTLVQAIRSQDLRSVTEVFAALAPNGEEDAKSKMGLASLLKLIWGADAPDDREGRFINDRVHANIQKDGTFSVVPQMRGGVTTPEQLRRIADVAEKYAVPMVKLTGGQRIDLLGIRKEDLPHVWADLGMPSGFAYGKSFRTVKTCVGQEFCRFGLGDSTKLGVDLETRMQGMESPAKMKLSVSGCPRNCAESYVKDVGIVAIEGGRWEIYIGGAAGAHVRKGDLLATVDDAETAKKLTGRFLQYYREKAKWLERTYAFVPRVGLDHIKSVVVEDAECHAERLDAAVQEHADSYVDPWTQQAAEPMTPVSSGLHFRWKCCPECPWIGPSSCSVVPGERRDEHGRGATHGGRRSGLGRVPARPGRPDPPRRGPCLRCRRPPDCGVPQAGRQSSGPVRDLPAQGWSHRRRSNRQQSRALSAPHERFRAGHRMLHHRCRTVADLSGVSRRRRDRRPGVLRDLSSA
jgi:nitrite reductase (NADH) large subunit